MDKDSKDLLQKQSAKYIADLFINHDIDCTIDGNKILFDKEQISIEAICFNRNSAQDFAVIQLDVYIFYGIDPIIESFAGLGEDFDSANADAFENFKVNSFHTILSAFFTSKFNKEIQRNTWNISNKNFEVYLSNIGIRGTKPTNLSTKWLYQLEDEIKKLPLAEGLHWIRLFYSQTANQTTVCEVLLNNEVCTSIAQKAQKFNWDKQEEFYSLRVFIILKNGIDFKRIIKIIGSSIDYDDLFSTLKGMGLSELEIEKAYAFIPEAFGRKLVKDMGLLGTHTNEVVIINGNQEEFEVNLNNEKMYQTAFHLAHELTKNGWDDELKDIAFMSAAFDTLNNALDNGVQLEDLNCGSFGSVFFIPTYAETTTIKQEKKPFWKFW